MFKLIIRKEGFETKLQALESPDSDKRAKSYTKMKIGSGIAIRKIADLIREKKWWTPVFFLSFFLDGTENEARRTSAAESSAVAAQAAQADWGGADGLGRLGAALFKGCPRAVSARVRPEVGSFFLIYSARKKNKKKY